jgi:hypothetical protein
MNDTFEIEYEISIEDVVKKYETIVNIYELNVDVDFVQAVSYIEDVLLYDEIGYKLVDNSRVTNVDDFLKWVRGDDGSDFVINYEIDFEDSLMISREIQISRIEFDADTHFMEDFLICIVGRDIRNSASVKFLNVDDFEEWHEKINDTDSLCECR